MSSPRITQNDLDEAKPKKSKPKERLTVVFDPATSLSKILYLVNNGTVKWMTMGAEYLSLPSASAESLFDARNGFDTKIIKKIKNSKRFIKPPKHILSLIEYQTELGKIKLKTLNPELTNSFYGR